MVVRLVCVKDLIDCCPKKRLNVTSTCVVVCRTYLKTDATKRNLRTCYSLVVSLEHRS